MAPASGNSSHLRGGGGGGVPTVPKLLYSLASSPGPFERAWYAKVRHVTSLCTSMGVSMETPPFTMTSFQSAYGKVAAWCEYSNSETDGRIAS